MINIINLKDGADTLNLDRATSLSSDIPPKFNCEEQRNYISTRKVIIEAIHILEY